jgi:ribosomal-protein-alanine N-acetyltransferase
MDVRPIRTRRLELVAFEPQAIRYLIACDRAAAETAQGLTLPDEFPTEDELHGFLPIQLKRMEAEPDKRSWMARLILTETKEVAGHCGFHGPPKTIGRAEIGYTVFNKFRGQGFAKEAARALAEWAFEQGEAVVYASVSPNNAPSLAVVKSLGFQQIGVQEDEVDGLELVFTLRRASST